MDKPRVVIIVQSKRNAKVIREQLNELLGGFICFDSLSYEDGIDSIVCADLVLVSSLIVAGQIAKYLMPGTDILVIRRTIKRENWEKLMTLPLRTKALLVNGDQEVAIETVALLYELGVKHLELIPYYPGLEPISDVNIAITPNEERCVPKNIQRIINIGDRVVDSTTIFDILNKFDLLNKKTSQIVLSHIAKIIPKSPGLSESLSLITESRQHLGFVLDVVHEGVIAFNEEDKITLYNKLAEQIFKESAWRVIGTHLEGLLNSKNLRNISNSKEIKDEVYIINGNSLVVNKYSLVNKGIYTGGVITFKECNEIERLELKFRQDIKVKGHVSKYVFNDILGQSKGLSFAVAMAKKFAKSDSVILIEGESGTGKELFAHAIHNASLRKDKPFVAFNCAALTDSLIESELFGYSDGAFTGAKKGGKPGLFELAHKGTIFLDEIGDISFNVQARLLRVIQEKEVIRVGGTDVIPVDIRIITATNKSLHVLESRGKFRSDLFYRLNILPIKIPPLRERKVDIPYLVEYFFNKKGIKEDISKELMEILQLYNWPGNVRELENCIDYMINVRNHNITRNDLPPYILEAIKSDLVDSRESPKGFDQLGIPQELVFILRVLKEAQELQKKIGRRTIADKLKEYGYNLTEQEIRGRLKKLESYGYIEVNKGRAGTKISFAGDNFIKTHL